MRTFGDRILGLTRSTATLAVLFSLAGCGAGGPGSPTSNPMPQDLVPLISADNPYLSRTVMLIAQTGDQATVYAAGERLTALAVQLIDDPTLHDGLRQRRLSQVYSAMVAVPTPSVMLHCRAIANDLGRSPWLRAMSTAVVLAQADAVPPQPTRTPDPAPVMTPPSSAVVVSTPADADAEANARVGIRPADETETPVTE